MHDAADDPYFGNPRPDMAPFIPEGLERVLELGCGSGLFGEALKRSGVREVVGIEASPGPARAAAQRLDRVIVANVERDPLDLPADGFDCLVCNDVLEHLTDPWAALKKLQPCVRAQGWLIVSIPNVRHHKVVRRLIWPGQWRYEDDGILDRTHLRFFTRSSARELVESAGFRIERMEGINPSSLPLWLRLINVAVFGALDDMRYLQFAIVARRL
jgi:2-polyprenyl-3-methyl-5-hydroxy-6-metoxy-1,4-benzoquinol methylase